MKMKMMVKMKMMKKKMKMMMMKMMKMMMMKMKMKKMEKKIIRNATILDREKQLFTTRLQWKVGASHAFCRRKICTLALSSLSHLCSFFFTKYFSMFSFY
jgi:hypothetical protein